MPGDHRTATAGEPVTAPFGSWTSAWTAAEVVAGARGLSGLVADGRRLAWAESRPAEGGRVAVLMWTSGGEVQDVLPRGMSARSRVHEYGGGVLAMRQDWLAVVNDADQAIYVREADGPWRRLDHTPGLRHADPCLDLPGRRCVVVEEDHRSGSRPVSRIVALELDGSARVVLAEGADFHAAPRTSRDGQWLAWLEWDDPDMPWDSTRLVLAGRDGRERRIVAGGPGVSVVQPEWDGEGRLWFAEDRSGRWQLAWCVPEDTLRFRPGPPAEGEVGQPAWVFAMHSYAVATGVAAIVDRRGGRGHLLVEDRGIWEAALPDLPDVSDVAAGEGLVAVIASSPADPPAVRVRVDRGAWQTIWQPGMPPDPEQVSWPRAVWAPGPAGEVHAWFYPPHNPAFRGPDGALPPLLVRTHGGPTSQATAGYAPSIQYWTSRGIAVVDVNYSGSTGFGRAYRERLRGRWGELDVADVVAVVDRLVRDGLVDGDRVAIAGGSAGGLTTLACLVFTDRFRAGLCRYGIGDLRLLAQDTHKFEARYLDGLVGPWPEARAVYEARSPGLHLDRLAAPILVLQGGEDKVVPPSQAEAIVAAAEAAGAPVALVLFPDEGHGFRKAGNMERALKAELTFLGAVFGFETDEAVPDLEIRNLA